MPKTSKKLVEERRTPVSAENIDGLVYVPYTVISDDKYEESGEALLVEFGKYLKQEDEKHQSPKGKKAKAIHFASAETRIGYETANAVAALVSKLPPEGPELNAEAITFAPEDELRGLTAVYTAGTVIYTDHPGVVCVPERSRFVLDWLEIPYQTVTDPGRNDSER